MALKRVQVVLDEALDAKLDADTKRARQNLYLQSKSALGYAYIMAGIEVYEAAQEKNPLAVDIWMRTEAKVKGTYLEAEKAKGGNVTAAKLASSAAKAEARAEREELDAEAQARIDNETRARRGKVKPTTPAPIGKSKARGKKKDKDTQENA